MIAQKDIAKAITSVLKNNFGYPVYLDEIKENYSAPCFFLKLIKTSTPQNKLLFSQLTVLIYFFSEKGNNNTIQQMEVKDTIFNELSRGVKINDRYLKFHQVTTETVANDSDIVEFEFKSKYYEQYDMENTDIEMITNIHTNSIYK